MNAKRSLVFWILACIIFVGVLWAFAHGAQMEETGPKIAWMVGSLVVAALGVFLSYKLKKK